MCATIEIVSWKSSSHATDRKMKNLFACPRLYWENKIEAVVLVCFKEKAKKKEDYGKIYDFKMYYACLSYS